MVQNYDIVPIEEVIRAAEREHSHFFSEGAKRFFRSRWDQTAYKWNGYYFWVTSERFSDSEPRKYTVRFACCDCMSMQDVSGFQAFSTHREAIARLQYYLTHDDKKEVNLYHHWKMELKHVTCASEKTGGV